MGSHKAPYERRSSMALAKRTREECHNPVRCRALLSDRPARSDTSRTQAHNGMSFIDISLTASRLASPVALMTSAKGYQDAVQLISQFHPQDRLQ
jgi:hypothetical protein